MTGMQEANIRAALRNHDQAVEVFLRLREILHTWDDLIDQDREVNLEAVNRAFFDLLVGLGQIPFWRAHQDRLSPVLVAAIANWHAANQFEAADDERRLHIAFIIRSDYANLLIVLAYLVGGYEWMREVTPTIRDLWTDETFASYLDNLASERQARAQKKGA